MSNSPILNMALFTGAGWGISLSTVESVARIVSLLVPAVLSIMIYVKNQKNRKGKGEK